MPMIDVYATTGTFATKHQLAQDLAKTVMRWEGVPAIPLFLDNTAASFTSCRWMRSRTQPETATTFEPRF